LFQFTNPEKGINPNFTKKKEVLYPNQEKPIRCNPLL